MWLGRSPNAQSSSNERRSSHRVWPAGRSCNRRTPSICISEGPRAALRNSSRKLRRACARSLPLHLPSGNRQGGLCWRQFLYEFFRSYILGSPYVGVLRCFVIPVVIFARIIRGDLVLAVVAVAGKAAEIEALDA